MGVPVTGRQLVARAHLARPTFYERLRHIERFLGVSLADPELPREGVAAEAVVTSAERGARFVLRPALPACA